jgi:multidrug efflux pump subunit AcrA (membrane-fusion protein)
MAPHSTITPPMSSAAIEAELGQLRLYAPTLLNTASSHRTFFRWIAALAVAALAAMFLPWQQNVQGTGTVSALRPQDRPQTLPSVIDGQISEWLVREGQFVRKGQLIARITEVKEAYLDPNIIARTTEQRDAKSAAIADKRRVAEALAQQGRVLEQALALKLDQTRNKIRQYEADVRATEVDSAQKVDQLQRREALYRDGLVDLNSLQTFRLNVQKAFADLAEKRAGLQNARIDLDAAQAEYQEKIVKARADRAKTLAEVNEGLGEVAGYETKISALEVRRGFYDIRAPQDGYVVQAQQTGLGETIKAGDPIVTVQPAAPERAVEIYVKPMDAPLIRTGDPVRLQFDGWPALQFAGWPSVSVGTFGGRVAVVDRVTSRTGQFRVLVVPDSTDEPWPAQLRMGTGVYGWTMLREVRVWYEIWRQLNGFPPSVAQPTDPVFGTSAGKGGGAKDGEGKK